MFDRGWHATIVPGDPPRTTVLALWPTDPDASAGDGAAPVELVLPSDGGGVTRVLRSARHLSITELLDELIDLPHDDPAVSTTLRAWAVVARQALGVVARGRIQPAISPGGWDSWSLGPLDERDREHRRALAAWLPPAAHCLAIGTHGRTEDPPTMLGAGAAIAAFGAAIADVAPPDGRSGHRVTPAGVVRLGAGRHLGAGGAPRARRRIGTLGRRAPAAAARDPGRHDRPASRRRDVRRPGAPGCRCCPG